MKSYKILSVLLNGDRDIYFRYQNGDSDEKINRQDLVKTLSMDRALYEKPVVDLDEYGFMVRGNNIYFEAGMQLKFDAFICDVNLDTLDDKHMSQFQLIDVTTEESQIPNKYHYIFFLDRDFGGSQYEKTGEGFLKDLRFAAEVQGFSESIDLECPEDDIIDLNITKRLKIKEADTIFEEVSKLISNYVAIRSVNGRKE